MGKLDDGLGNALFAGRFSSTLGLFQGGGLRIFSAAGGAVVVAFSAWRHIDGVWDAILGTGCGGGTHRGRFPTFLYRDGQGIGAGFPAAT